MGDQLLTTKEVEHLVQLNRVTIYRLIRTEGFPALKVGGQWRFPKEEVENWIADHGRVTETHHGPQIVGLDDEHDVSLDVEPAELLRSIEIISLLEAFSFTVELSIAVFDIDGKMLVDYPGYQHPFCQFVRQIDPTHGSCFGRHHLLLDEKHTQESPVAFDDIPGLHYLQAPIWTDQVQVGYIVMGPLVMENSDPELVRHGLETLAKRYSASSDGLIKQFETVRRFSNDQVRILTTLLSQIVSNMLEVVHRRTDAVQRLNTIARLAADV
ncbi:MAG: PocR ligand-binding domain-containing protein [Anaerolineae bacterium]|nr:PocR ligand-binding domain-containing protein [Anaerolineae bacterium]